MAARFENALAGRSRSLDPADRSSRFAALALYAVTVLAMIHIALRPPFTLAAIRAFWVNTLAMLALMPACCFLLWRSVVPTPHGPVAR